MLFWQSVWHEERGKKAIQTSREHRAPDTHTCTHSWDMKTRKWENWVQNVCVLRALCINIKISFATVAASTADKLNTHFPVDRARPVDLQSNSLSPFHLTSALPVSFEWNFAPAANLCEKTTDIPATPPPTLTTTTPKLTPATFFIENYERNRTNTYNLHMTPLAL